MKFFKWLWKLIKRTDLKYPWSWGMDLESTYKSIWLGWWLITFTTDPFDDFGIDFQPGL